MLVYLVLEMDQRTDLSSHLDIVRQSPSTRGIPGRNEEPRRNIPPNNLFKHEYSIRGIAGLYLSHGRADRFPGPPSCRWRKHLAGGDTQPHGTNCPSLSLLQPGRHFSYSSRGRRVDSRRRPKENSCSADNAIDTVPITTLPTTNHSRL